MRTGLIDQGYRNRHQLVVGMVSRLNKANLPYTADVVVQDTQGQYTMTDCLIVSPSCGLDKEAWSCFPPR